MVKGGDQNAAHPVPMSRYLGRRVLFSVLVILLLLVALGTGLLGLNPTP